MEEKIVSNSVAGQKRKWSQVVIDKAIENLAAAQDCFQRNQFNAAANRAYYAMYHAAVAALNETGYVSERVDGRWQHGTLKRAFNLQLGPASSGLFPERCYRYLDDGYAIRVKADYRPDNVEKEEAAEIVQWCSDMVQTIRKQM